METSPLDPWVPQVASERFQSGAVSDRYGGCGHVWSFAGRLLAHSKLVHSNLQAGIAGVTRLYISGLCFAATRGTGVY